MIDTFCPERTHSSIYEIRKQSLEVAAAELLGIEFVYQTVNRSFHKTTAFSFPEQERFINGLCPNFKMTELNRPMP